MAEPSEPRMTLRGVGAVRSEPEPEPEPAPDPVPNPAVQLGDATPPPEPSGRMTAPLPRQQPVQPAPSQQVMAPVQAPVRQDGTVGDGPIRVVCRHCQRTVWGWKLPFGVSCPMGPHHSHVNWFLVGVVASFWAAFTVFLISMIGIAA